MDTRSSADGSRRALALAAIVLAAALVGAAPLTVYAQRGGPGGAPNGEARAHGGPGAFPGHAGNWRGGVPGGWRGGRRGGHGQWSGGFAWSSPFWPWGWGWGFSGGGLAEAAPAPSPYSYRFLYDSPYYYPDYDSYHGFSYPY